MKLFSKVIGIVFLVLVGCKTSVINIYVSSTKPISKEGDSKVVVSLEEALKTVLVYRENKNNAPIQIHLEAGEYRLSSPIKIGPEHGVVEIIGAGTDKTTIKGSELLNIKWEKYNDHIWKAQLDANTQFDQLFLNNEQQILARYPNYDENSGHWQGHAADAIAKERIQNWTTASGAIVHAMHSGEWGGFHFRATGVDDTGELVLEGGHQNNRPSKMNPKYRMVENVFEELDSPGEWYVDLKNTLFYWPSTAMDLQSTIAEGVTQKHLIEIIGTEENPVLGVTIKGIKFEHAQRTLFEEYEPLLRSDWTMYRGAAILLEGTKDITIANNEFTNLGGNVILVSNYNRGTKITDNHIYNCGASAISFVGSPSAVRSPSFQYSEFVSLAEMDTVKGPKSNKYPADALVDNNLIHRIGRVEKQTAGVQIAMAMHITVSNNSIYDVPRAGINIGDGTWGGHIIEFNDVFNTVLESGDHGAFNSWGRDRFWHPNRGKLNEIVANNPEMPKWDAIHTTIIRNNRFRCDHGWDIDLDDGSSNYHIYNNVCLNGGLKLREGFFRTVENNIILNNGFHPHVWFKNSGDVFKENIVFTEHRDIRLAEWGKEVDYNFFPSKEALDDAQKKGVDAHSIYGSLEFADAANGNYDLKENTAAAKIGFQPFKTDVFGVKNEKLKALAQKPTFPDLYFSANSKASDKVTWQHAVLKNIETMAERSASGLNKTAGVLVVSLEESSILKKSGIAVGDVIVSAEGKEINSIADLISTYQKLNWKGKIGLGIFRNQKEQQINLTTK
ncbi:PDZ domain-containing protein [Cellulophaga sp. F20128]|uniref:PDZ domain-containing protein n=1 Tax=Cellulophaga sp. F20128 TaxID=2926413 RepID=UPI001FF4C2FB|nr:PDZ domain-containing protein [Cellulophaga sp. F20128]MCK0156292.1 PDZ domain-containing protein [Cellulophaga sp. F20128]